MTADGKGSGKASASPDGGAGAAPAEPAAKPKPAPKGRQGHGPGKPAGQRKPAPQSAAADGHQPTVEIPVVWAAVGREVKQQWWFQGMCFQTPNVRRFLDQQNLTGEKNALICPLPKAMVDLLRQGGERRVKAVKGKRLPHLHLFDADQADGSAERSMLVGSNYGQWGSYKEEHPVKPFFIEAAGWSKDLEF